MSAIGALVGLILSIVLIIRKIFPAYSLILGAVVGGLLGGFRLPEMDNYDYLPFRIFNQCICLI